MQTSEQTMQVPPKLIAELKQIQQAALISDYAYDQLAYITRRIGPRLSGSAQAQAAVEYIAAELRRLGLEVRLEKVAVPHWVRGEEKAELVNASGETTQKLVLTTLGGSTATAPNGVTAEVVTVGTFDELSALGSEKVKGKLSSSTVPSISKWLRRALVRKPTARWPSIGQLGQVRPQV